MTDCCSASWIWLDTNGSVAAITVMPTRILAGMPTTNTFICGTARETRPMAASVITSATRAGAAISRPIAHTCANPVSIPIVRPPMCG